MKTTLPQSIKTVEEAKKFLTELHNNNEVYHPDDDAADIIDRNGKTLFTKSEAKKLDALMGDINEVAKSNLVEFDQYEFILRLDPEYVLRIEIELLESAQDALIELIEHNIATPNSHNALEEIRLKLSEKRTEQGF